MDIGKRIKFFRNLRNLSQEELAEKIGISRTALYYYEANKRKPTFEVLEKITDVLNITLEELINGDIFKDFDYINNNTRKKINLFNFNKKTIEKIIDIYSDKEYVTPKEALNYFNEVLKEGYKQIDENDNKSIEKDTKKILFSTVANIISTEELSNSIEYKFTDFTDEDLKEITDFLFNIYKLKVKEILKRKKNK